MAVKLANVGLVNGARTWIADLASDLITDPKYLDCDIALITAADGSNAYDTYIYKIGLPGWVKYIDDGATSTSWDLSGNAGTNPLTNFIGTSDVQNLSIRTNSIEAIQVDSNQFVGIGGSADSNARLLIKGSGTSNFTLGLRVEAANSSLNFSVRDDGTSSFFGNALNGVRLNIAGVTDDSSTMSLRVANSSNVASMVVLGDGTVGIGTSNPLGRLDVRGQSVFLNATSTISGGLSSFITNYGTWVEGKTGDTQTGIEVGILNGVNIGTLTANSSASFSGSTNYGYYEVSGGFNLTNPDSSLRGAQGGIINLTTSGVITSAAGFFSMSHNYGSGSTITNLYDFKAQGLFNGFLNNGTTTNWYGYYVTDQAGAVGKPGASNRWNFYGADNSQSYFNGNSGFGIINPAARVHIVGVDDSSSSYSMQIDNSSLNPILYVRNDERVGIRTSSPSARLGIVTDSVVGISIVSVGQAMNITAGNAYAFDINGDGVNTFGMRVFQCYTGLQTHQSFNGSYGIVAGMNAGVNATAIYAYSNDFGVAIRPESNYSTALQVRQGESLTLTQSSSSNLAEIRRNVVLGIYDLTGSLLDINDLTASTGDLLTITKQLSPVLSIKNTKDIGIGTTTPFARTHIVSSGTTTSTYSLKIDDSANSQLFYINDEGSITSISRIHQGGGAIGWSFNVPVNPGNMAYLEGMNITMDTGRSIGLRLRMNDTQPTGFGNVGAVVESGLSNMIGFDYEGGYLPCGFFVNFEHQGIRVVGDTVFGIAAENIGTVDTSQGSFVARRARGTAVGDVGFTNAGDLIGSMLFQAFGEANPGPHYPNTGYYVDASKIASYSVLGSGTGVATGDLRFYTNNNSAAVTERMRITETGNVGVGTTTPDASALIDMVSTTRGFAPPSMTGAQAEAIVSPKESLLIYSTDGSGATITSKGWWGWDGTTWVKLN